MVEATKLPLSRSSRGRSRCSGRRRWGEGGGKGVGGGTGGREEAIYPVKLSTQLPGLTN